MATISDAFALAIRHHQGGRLHEAEQIYRQVLALEPNRVEALVLLGEIVEQNGNLDEAVACWRRVLQLKPGFALAHNNLGVACKAQGNLNEAIACYRRALELGPDYAQAHNNLGVACKERGNLDEAIACCRRAVELKPDYAEGAQQPGRGLARAGPVGGSRCLLPPGNRLQAGLRGSPQQSGHALLADQGKTRRGRRLLSLRCGTKTGRCRGPQ